jgi:hypothetical protein
MKSMLFLGVAGCLLAHPLCAQTTGRGALNALTKAQGAGIGSRIVLVTGEQGQDQPPSWRIVARDPEVAGRFHEYIIRNNKVVQASPLASVEAPVIRRSPLVVKRVKVDSTTAFMAADQAAKKALIGFDSLDYELRNKELSQDPVWLVRLRDTSGSPAGELIISAESGAVLRKTWYESPRPAPSPAVAATAPRSQAPAQGAPAPRDPAAPGVSQKAQQIWEDTRNGLEQGRQVVKTGFQKAGTSVRGWFERLRRDSSAPRSEAWGSGTYDPSAR